MAGHRAYMKLYVGDFAADTLHLDATGVGAYMLLILHYWQHRGLPDDNRELASIARLSPHKWKKISPVLAKLFQQGWRHKRIDHELQLADELHEKLSLAGVIGRAKQRPMHRPGLGQATHTSYKNITNTETVAAREEEVSRAKQDGTRKIEPTDALAETIKRKGWTQ